MKERFNVFKKMQKELDSQKIEIIPDNTEDAEIAQQMTNLLNFIINDFLSFSNELVDNE